MLKRLSVTALCAVLSIYMMLLSACALADAGQLSMNRESGFYRSPISLSIDCSNSRSTVYYTLDGSTPDENSFVYSRPIALDISNEREDVLTKIPGTYGKNEFMPTDDFPTAHVVRAVAIDAAGSRSEEVCGTFFVGYEREELYGDTPIMCLITDPQGLFDYETGIYVRGKVYDEWIVQQDDDFADWEIVANYTQRGSEWERLASVTYLPAQGEGFTQNMGLRIKGNLSRNSGQKSLRLIAREEYGAKNLRYELYPENIGEYNGAVVDKYKSFTLRNGGSDCLYAKIRDPLIMNLAEGLRMETSANMPCIAFLNGEYWGIYTLTEEYSKNYFQYHYGVDDDYMVIVKNGRLEDGLEEDIDLFKDAYDYITENDMSDPACYEAAGKLMDLESIADYCALHLYVLNEDGPLDNNNWQMWRVREPGVGMHPFADGKWRMVLFDTDYSSGVYDRGENAQQDNVTPALKKPDEEWRNYPTLFYSLLANEEFRREVIVSCCDVRNLFFSQSRTAAVLEEMKADYAPYMADTMRRFGPETALFDPEERAGRKIGEISTFFDARYDCFMQIVGDAFELGAPCTVTIEIADPEKGQVYVNGRDVPVSHGEKLAYFPQYGLNVQASANWGSRFVGWEVVEGEATLSAPKNKATAVEFDTSFTLRAVFK